MVFVILNMTSCLLSLLSLGDSAILKPVKFVFDESIPTERSTKIIITGIRPVSYNGIDIDKAYGIGEIFEMTMPAGDGDFGFAFYMFRDYPRITYRYFIEGYHFRYTFEAGREYRVRLHREGKPRKSMFETDEYLYYVRVYYDWDSDKLKGEELKRYLEEDYLLSVFLFDSDNVR